MAESKFQQGELQYKIFEKIMATVVPTLELWLADFSAVSTGAKKDSSVASNTPASTSTIDGMDTPSRLHEGNADAIVVRATIGGVAKSYAGYLVVDERGRNYVNSEYMANDDIKRVCSMLFDGVLKFFPAIIKSFNLHGLFYEFDESRLAFDLVAKNTARLKRDVVTKRIEMFYRVLSGEPRKPDEPEFTAEEIETIKQALIEHKHVLSEINDEDIVAEDKMLRVRESQIKSSQSLYIIVSEMTEEDVEDRLSSALPKVGESSEVWNMDNVDNADDATTHSTGARQPNAKDLAEIDAVTDNM